VAGELLIITGETDGSATSGEVPLDSDLFHSKVKYFRIPRGCKAKIWFKKASGEGETLFTLEYTHDVTAEPPAWKPIEHMKLASKGELSLDKRRPVIVRSITGKEAIHITWSQPTAAKAYVELGVEIE